MDNVTSLLAGFKAAMVAKDYCTELISCDKFEPPTIITVKENYRIVFAAFEHFSTGVVARDILIEVFCRLDEESSFLISYPCIFQVWCVVLVCLIIMAVQFAIRSRSTAGVCLGTSLCPQRQRDGPSCTPTASTNCSTTSSS
jgi:hypothetical protein